MERCTSTRHEGEFNKDSAIEPSARTTQRVSNNEYACKQQTHAYTVSHQGSPTAAARHVAALLAVTKAVYRHQIASCKAFQPHHVL